MSADLDSLLAQFLRERKYLRNLRPQALEWYETAWGAFRKSATSCLTDSAALNRAYLEQFVYTLRDRGVRPQCLLPPATRERPHAHPRSPTTAEGGEAARRYARRRGHPRLRQLQAAVAVTVNKHHMDGPRKGQKNFAWWHIHALACALLDTGCRVQELLDARVQDFDMDDLLVTVVGKGDKERRIPFSIDLRRILFRYVQQRDRFGVPAREPFMFPAHSGGAWDQRNALRFFYDLQKKLRLHRMGFHRLRHTCAQSPLEIANPPLCSAIIRRLARVAVKYSFHAGSATAGAPGGVVQVQASTNNRKNPHAIVGGLLRPTVGFSPATPVELIAAANIDRRTVGAAPPLAGHLVRFEAPLWLAALRRVRPADRARLPATFM